LPHFWLTSAASRDFTMKKTIVLAAATLSLMSSHALADEHRGGDAALGALAGAVVLGPVGAIAGAAVGYTAGPSIAHSWGFRHSGSAARRVRHTQAPAAQQASANRPATPAPAAAKVPAPVRQAGSSAPPVQTLE
jgi:hypothetical protein